MEEVKKRNPLINILLTEWEFLGNRKKIFLFYMFLFVIAGVISLMTHLVIGYIFNFIQQQGDITSPEGFKKLIMLISLILVIKVAHWGFHGPARIMEQLTSFSVHKRYTNSKIKKVLELPVKWHKDNHSGDTIDKINRARGSLEDFSESRTFQLVYILLNIFGSLIILLFINVQVAIFSLIFCSLMLFAISRVDKRLTKYYKELNQYSNKLSASVFDYVSNIITIITLRLKKTVSTEIDNKLVASYSTYKKAAIIDEIKWAVGSIAITLMTVLVLIYKSYIDYTTSGVILIGTLYILFGYLRTVGDSFFQFGQFYGGIVRGNARIEGTYPIDEAFDEIKEKIGGQLPDDWKKVDLKNIDFTYDVKGHTRHMKDVNFNFHRGQKIALIGESGSGKSTVLALLRGLYPPQKGKVYVNGKELGNGFERLKRNITLIPQEPELFNNTIKYNITMDLPTRKDDLQKAMQMAQFENVVLRLEKGLNSNVLEKGVSLSGGEKQRLALTRGLLAAKKSDIVLLDEPTSSVDSVNEIKIHENIFKEFKNKTIISSIHRLHLLNKFDYIYMFERGKIVAQGTLSEMKRNPRFKLILNKYKVSATK